MTKFHLLYQILSIEEDGEAPIWLLAWDLSGACASVTQWIECPPTKREALVRVQPDAPPLYNTISIKAM